MPALPKYKLTYFALPGLAEKVRLSFLLANVPFEDVRITFDEWPALKGSAPCGQLPLLTIDGGEPITQSEAMVRMIGENAGLIPTCSVQKLALEEIIGTVNDIYRGLVPAMYILRRPEGLGQEDRSEDERKAISAKLAAAQFAADGQVTILLKRLDALLKKNGSTGFAVGARSTIADAYLLPTIAFLKLGVVTLPDNYFDAFPELVLFETTQMALPVIAKWYKEHPPVPM